MSLAGTRFVSLVCGDDTAHGMCVEACSRGGREAVVCCAGRACGNVTQYVYARSGRTKMHQMFVKGR